MNHKPIDMKNVLKLFLWTFLIVAGVLLLMVISDLINPHREIEVVIEPDFIVYPELGEAKAKLREWDNDSSDWHTEQWENEVAFNLGIDTSEVTEEQVTQRYGEGNILPEGAFR